MDTNVTYTFTNRQEVYIAVVMAKHFMMWNKGAITLFPTVHALSEMLHVLTNEQYLYTLDDIPVFLLQRKKDVSGVSGCGNVAWGCILPDKQVCMEWQRDPYSFTIYQNIDAVETIHSHENATKIVFIR